MKQNIKGSEKNIQFNQNKTRPDERDNLDSRKKEEQYFKADDITHSKKDNRNNRHQKRNRKLMANDMNELQVHSVAFGHNGHIPPEYTCEGENINPPLEVSNVPEGTKTLALIMEDPDAPGGYLITGLYGIFSPMKRSLSNLSPVSMEQIVLEKQDMPAHLHHQVLTAISLKFLQ